MIQDKVQLLREIDDESNLKAYEFILRMAKVNLPDDPDSPEIKSKAEPHDVKIVKEVQFNLKKLGFENQDATIDKNKESQRDPERADSTKILPFFEEEGFETEFFIDQFESIEALNEYYKDIRRGVIVKEFK